MTDDIERARARYLERLAVYHSHGYDRAAAVRFVVDQLEAIERPVLDVGTGQGLLAIELARRCGDVVSVDISETEQRVGRANALHQGVLDRIAFRLTEPDRLPFEDGTFGTVAMLDAVHHLTDGPRTFSELRRVTKPGGRILLADFSPEGFALIDRVHQAEGRVHPVGAVTMAEAVSWFEGEGMTLASASEGHLHEVRVFR